MLTRTSWSRLTWKHLSPSSSTIRGVFLHLSSKCEWLCARSSGSYLLSFSPVQKKVGRVNAAAPSLAWNNRMPSNTFIRVSNCNCYNTNMSNSVISRLVRKCKSLHQNFLVEISYFLNAFRRCFCRSVCTCKLGATDIYWIFFLFFIWRNKSHCKIFLKKVIHGILIIPKGSLILFFLWSHEAIWSDCLDFLYSCQMTWFYSKQHEQKVVADKTCNCLKSH